MSVGIKQDITDFSVIMRNPDRESTGFNHRLESHDFIAAWFNPWNLLQNRRFTSWNVGLQSLIPLLKPQTQVMESGYSVAYRFTESFQQTMKTPDTASTFKSLWCCIHPFIRHWAGHKFAHSPILPLFILPIKLRKVPQRNLRQYFTRCIAPGCNSSGFQIGCNRTDIFHHCGNIAKHTLVFTLQDIVTVTIGCQHPEGVIDEPLPHILYPYNFTRYVKPACNFFEFLHDMLNFALW